MQGVVCRKRTTSSALVGNVRGIAAGAVTEGTQVSTMLSPFLTGRASGSARRRVPPSPLLPL